MLLNISTVLCVSFIYWHDEIYRTENNRDKRIKGNGKIANRYATTLMFSAYTVCTVTLLVIRLFLKLTEIDIIRKAISVVL